MWVVGGPPGSFAAPVSSLAPGSCIKKMVLWGGEGWERTTTTLLGSLFGVFGPTSGSSPVKRRLSLISIIIIIIIHHHTDTRALTGLSLSF